jgi:hypothetical protein
MREVSLLSHSVINKLIGMHARTIVYTCIPLTFEISDPFSSFM